MPVCQLCQKYRLQRGKQKLRMVNKHLNLANRIINVPRYLISSTHHDRISCSYFFHNAYHVEGQYAYGKIIFSINNRVQIIKLLFILVYYYYYRSHLQHTVTIAIHAQNSHFRQIFSTWTAFSDHTRPDLFCSRVFIL